MTRVAGARPLLSLIGLMALLLPAAAQGPGETRLLREARPGEMWVTAPTIGSAPPAPVRPGAGLVTSIVDATPPSTPTGMVADANGLTRILARWDPSSDPESGVPYYVFALGTGTTPETEVNLHYWQLTTSMTASFSLRLTEGAAYYVSIKALNGANLYSEVVRSGPIVAAQRTYGQPGTVMSYVIPPTGLDENGGVISTWSPARVAELSDFMDKMLAVLGDLYGPPSSPYQVRVVRDQYYVTSAIFFPSTDEIHVGDAVTYQLLTHEMIHAMRRDRVISSDRHWEYDPTLSGFEEGFAQAVSYDAMTEFARRYPSFGLTAQIYESSHGWDYDFQNVPQLRTTDFWSDSSGMNLHYMRYEVAAAAIAKMEIEHPGFYRLFNAEYYRRLNEDPLLTPSRALARAIVQAVMPTIEGLPAGEWIDRQYVFDCANHPGLKAWTRTQHYPTWNEYFIFQYPRVYETFANGSDWAIPAPGGGYTYYHLNGTTGTGTLRDSSGSVILQRPLLIAPIENPPVYLGFGRDEFHLTTQATNQPWPGGDASKFVTSLLPFDLYRLTTEFTVGSGVVSDTIYRVIGAPLRNATGVFGGVVGANGGRVLLHHRQFSTTQRANLTNAAFITGAPWASLDHPATHSNDTVPGMVDVTYIDAAGHTYSDARAIGFGSAQGNQLLLFDVSRMKAGDVAPVIVAQPAGGQGVNGGTATVSVVADGSGTLGYRWQRQSGGTGAFVDLADGGAFAGATSPALTVSLGPAVADDRFRCVIGNHVGTVTSDGAGLTVLTELTITAQPASLTVASGASASFSVAAVGAGTLTYQWERRPSGAAAFGAIPAGGPYAGVTSAALSIAANATMSGDQVRCVVTDGATMVTSAAATLTVTGGPSITSHPASVTVNAGFTATFSVMASGPGSLTYQWQRQPAGADAFDAVTDDGGRYSGATAAGLTVAAAAILSGDRFRCVVANNAGSTTSAAATLTVQSPPVITQQPVDRVVLRGDDARFVVTAAGTAPFTYQWQRRLAGAAEFTDLTAGGNYAGATSRDLSVTSDFPFSGQQFRCVISNPLGSVTTNVVTLTVGSLPALTKQPLQTSVLIGQNAVFAVAATGSPAPAYEWQRSPDGVDWSSIGDGAGFSGALTASLTVVKAPRALDGLRVRAVVSNLFGSVVSSPATLGVSFAGSVTPSGLTFGANRAADGSFSATGRQDVAIDLSGVAAAWTLSADQPWVHVTASSGTGASRFGVTVTDPGPGASGPQIAHVTIAVPTAANSPIGIPITLSIVPAPENAAPFGALDTPLDNAAGLTGSIAVTGWALDDVEVTRVRISRDPVASEPAGVPVHLGDASLVDGARPDLIAGFGAVPRNTRGGWGYLLLTNMLPNQGNGTYTLYVHADDANGHATLLGTRTITCNNLMATSPFGAIDTPAQGETVSGIVNNFGWVLSPGVRRADPLGGGSVTVFIDGVAVGSPSGWVERVDLTQLFPLARYSGVAHALAVFTFDSTKLANGVHTISWVVTDNMGEAAGIGSRYFTVANGTSLTAVQKR